MTMRKLHLLEKPYKITQHRENRFMSQLYKKQIEENQQGFKIRLLESQVNPLMQQVKLLENEMNCLKEVNQQQEDENILINQKLKVTLEELSKRAGTFHSAEESIRKKNLELQAMEEKLEKITNRMNNFELEKKKLATKNVIAEDRVKQANEAHEQLTIIIAKTEAREYEREQELIKEQERNELLVYELIEAEKAEREAETLNVFSTQSTIDEQAKQIAKLNQELILKKKQWENDRNQFRDDKQRLYQTIDRVTDMQKKYQLETKASTKNENHYREKCVDDIDVINNLEGEVLIVKGKLEGNDEIIAD